MKIRYIYKSILAASLFLASCNDVLDTQPYDKIGEDVVWSSKANVETFIFSTYGIMNSFGSGPGTDARTTNILAYDAVYNDASAVFTEQLDRHADYGFNNWGSVRRCNLIIQKMEESTTISEADKKELIAEAKFLRAMSYYNIARNTGRIVWIDHVLSPDDDMMLSSTKSPAESYAYIIKDLEDAVVDLSTEKIPGRANKYVAAAVLTEVLLQALAYENYPDAPSINNEFLDKAIKYGELVLQGGYSLESDYGGMFNEEKPTSVEVIYGIYRKGINTTVDGTPMQLMVPNVSNDQIRQGGASPLLKSPIRIFEAWGQHGPSQNFADDYLVIDKSDPSKAVKWFETSQYRSAVDESAQIPLEKIPTATGEKQVKKGSIKAGSEETIWTLNNENRDARWNQTVISDSSGVFYGETLTTTIKGNVGRWLKMEGHAYYQSLSNMYWRKGIYNNVNPRVYVGVPTDYHYVVTRLGRVYLNLAEAYLLKQNLPKGLEMMNKTRVVHGKLPESKVSTLAEAWTDYKRERRVDLVMENDYYWSLLRWGRYGGVANHNIPSGGTIPELTEVPRVMDVSKDRRHFSVVEGSFFSSNHIRRFDETRRYLFPVAQGYLDRNIKFGPQNPGW